MARFSDTDRDRPRGHHLMAASYLVAVVLALPLSACGRPPTAPEAMQACYTQLNAQTPDWRKRIRERNSKVKPLVARYMSLCMQGQHFKQAQRCNDMDVRCYAREPRWWERL